MPTHRASFLPPALATAALSTSLSSFPPPAQAADRNGTEFVVPAVDGRGVGRGFFLFALPSGKTTDLNVVAYEDSTVEVLDLTETPSSGTGVTSLRGRGEVVLRTTLYAGEDLTFAKGIGRDLLQPGHSYEVRSTGNVSVQMGAMTSRRTNRRARDGGAYVPSSTGDAFGEHFVFSIPYNQGRAAEKELHVVARDSNTEVSLFGITDSGEVLLEQRQLGVGESLDLQARAHRAFRKHKRYRIETNEGHAVSVFEGNWLSRAKRGRGDYATAVPSLSGGYHGHEFLSFIGPPGNRTRVAGTEDFFTHLFVYNSGSEAASLHVRDAQGLGLVDATLLAPAGEVTDVRIDREMYSQLLSGGNPHVRVVGDEGASLSAVELETVQRFSPEGFLLQFAPPADLDPDYAPFSILREAIPKLEEEDEEGGVTNRYSGQVIGEDYVVNLTPEAIAVPQGSWVFNTNYFTWANHFETRVEMHLVPTQECY